MNKTHFVLLATPVLLSIAISQAFAHDPKVKTKDSMKADPMGQMDMRGMAMTGDPDQDFATMMRAHHQKALPMARDEIAHGKDASMRRMAQTILDAQTKEVGEFDAWLAHHPMAKKGSAPMGQSMPAWKSFESLDKNNDGYLTHGELPSSEMLDKHFTEADVNHDGKLSKVEVEQHRAKMMQDMKH
jgi:hypothetical protein